MKALRRIFPFFLVLALGACGGDDNGSDDDPNTSSDTGTPDTDTGIDPCDGITDCSTEGQTCDGDDLVTCRENAAGCLVESSTTCENGCDDSEDEPICTPSNQCEDVQDCSVEGTSCEDGNLATCAPDEDDCLIESIEECEFGCDNSNNECFDEDPCVELDNLCDTAGSECLADVLVVCEADENGCLIENQTDCASGTQICGTLDGTLTCADACDFVETCSTSTSCEDEELVTCEPDENGCLIETDRRDCSASSATCAEEDGTSFCDGGLVLCEGTPIEVNCGSALVVEDGTLTPSNSVHGYCDTEPSYHGTGGIYHLNIDSAAEVDVQLAWSGTQDLDLFAIEALGEACTATADCLAGSLDGNQTESLLFGVNEGESPFIAVNSFDNFAEDLAFQITFTCTPTICGNGTLEGAEECEDGNSDIEDGCSDECLVEEGWVCELDGGTSLCHEMLCGDRIIEGDEECDDDNTENGDGCSEICEEEEGWVCENDPDAADEDPITTCHEVICGDGVIEGDETCDDGNAISEDGCSIICELEDDWVCETNDISPQTVNCHEVVCGDSVIEGAEECDDGNIEIGDGCGSDCAQELGYLCVGEPSSCLREGAGETCDDAIPITPGSYTFDTSEYENDYDSYRGDCGTTSTSGTGPDMVFQIEVPPHTFFGAMMNDIGGDEYFAISSDCADIVNSCLALDDEPGLVQWRNDTDDAATIFIIADGYGGTSASEYTLDIGLFPMVCGDGMIVADEECDDGNENSDDGCSETCEEETGFACENDSDAMDLDADPPIPETQCHEIICGDGFRDNTEICDDGNLIDFDGCSSICEMEDDWICIHDEDAMDMDADPPIGETQCHEVICGDGFRDGAESCDDGNASDFDGCSGECQYEDGFACENSYSENPVTTCREMVCGDGFIELEEVCDDGNTTDDDGCSSTCEEEESWLCENEPSDCHVVVCGDGIIERGEGCDDENENNGDGCNDSCMPETGYFCSEAPSVCILTEPGDVCTTAIPVDVGETDVYYRDGFHNAYNKYDGECGGLHGRGADYVFSIEVPDRAILRTTEHETDDEGQQPSENESVFDTVIALSSNCDDIANTCLAFRDDSDGSFVVWANDTGETQTVFIIADGWSDSDSYFDIGGFTLEVELENTICGDGTIEEEIEFCDDNNSSNNDGCSSTCEIEEGWVCEEEEGEPSECFDVICGDGLIHADEECDDANDQSDDGCSDECLLEDDWICDEEEPTFCHQLECGDGFIDGDEECDDTNTSNSDGCSDECEIEENWECRSLPSDCREAECGNALIEGLENCDDYNSASGDGCSDECQVEIGWMCVGDSYSVCSVVPCGDGQIQGAEECDDENEENGDGCSDICLVEDEYTCVGEPSACYLLLFTSEHSIEVDETGSHSFSITTDTSVIIETSAVPDEENMDTQIWLCEAGDDSCTYSGENLAYDDDDGYSLFSLIETDLSAGNYVVNVQEFSRNDPGQYILTISTTDPQQYRILCKNNIFSGRQPFRI